MPEEPNPRPDTYYVWQPPNRLITILLNLRLLDRLKLWMDKGMQAGEEVGGILLGRIEENASGEAVITVEDCETVHIGHQRGPTYTPNDKEKKQIAKRIGWWHAHGQSRAAVGLVRSHVRSGLYLDAADFALFQNYFPDSRSVFLLASTGEDATAGFFFWEDGDVHRQSPYGSFPFDRQKLEDGRHTILRPPEPMAARTAITPAKEKQPTAIMPGPSPLPRLRPSGLAWLAAAAIALVLMMAGLYWSRSSHGAPATATGFGLNIDHLGRALRLTWDPRAPAIAHAGQAVLSIRDGTNERRMVLNSRQLSHGSALYVPASDDVEFRLQVRKGANEIADSIRSVAALSSVPARDMEATSPTESNPVPAPQESSDRIATGQHPNPLQSEAKHPMAAPAARTRQLKGSADRIQSAVAALEEPERVEPAPILPPPPLVETPKAESAPPPPTVEPAARLMRRPVPTVSVNYEAAPESSLRQKLQKVPMLRMLQHNQYRGGDNFLPARPVHEVRPQLRMSVARALPGEWRVELRVSLDKHGRVAEVESLSLEADERLVMEAVSAVRTSQFEPAQLNGRDVSSRLLVTYHFRNPPQAPTIARTAP